MLNMISLALSKYDVHDRARFFKLSHGQCKGDFNTIVITSGNFEHQAGRTELKQFQLEMANVRIIV